MTRFLNRKVGLIIVSVIVVAIIGGGFAYSSYRDARLKIFRADTPLTEADAVNGQITLLGDDFSTDPLSDGWGHLTFLRHAATDYRMEIIDGRRALHCATDNSGSILGRNTSIPVAEFPNLSWEWKIETPIVSDVDEATRSGDDHPARFFVRFESTEGTVHNAEIIWSNRRFAPGDYKIIDGFHHLVANGLVENVGVWHPQTVDMMALYRTISERDDNPVLSILGFFCDSDNTGGTSSAYFSNIVLE